MPAYLLHQNMRTFYPNGDPLRMLAYTSLPVPPPLPGNWPSPIAPNTYGLGCVHTNAGHPAPLTPGRAPRQPICIAGFTEMHNANAVNAMPLAMTALGDAAPHVFVFNAGYTALTPAPEMVAIALAKPLKPLSFGRVVFAPGGDPILDVAPQPPPPNWFTNPPGSFGADYRWIPYIVLQVDKGGKQIAVGFTHNTYSLQTRNIFVERMVAVIYMIKAASPVKVDNVIIGGDFNALPREAGERYPVYTYWEVVKDKLGIFKGGQPHGTTWSGNLYDYWLSDIPLDNQEPIVPGGEPVPKASIDTATWDGRESLMSDHVATLLRIV
jgi:hypothetical protein